MKHSVRENARRALGYARLCITEIILKKNISPLAETELINEVRSFALGDYRYSHISFLHALLILMREVYARVR